MGESLRNGERGEGEKNGGEVSWHGGDSRLNCSTHKKQFEKTQKNGVSKGGTRLYFSPPITPPFSTLFHSNHAPILYSLLHDCGRLSIALADDCAG